MMSLYRYSRWMTWSSKRFALLYIRKRSSKATNDGRQRHHLKAFEQRTQWIRRRKGRFSYRQQQQRNSAAAGLGSSRPSRSTAWRWGSDCPRATSSHLKGDAAPLSCHSFEQDQHFKLQNVSNIENPSLRCRESTLKWTCQVQFI